MPDILEGVVKDVVDGEMIELEIDHVDARNASQYGAREYIRVTDGSLASHDDALDEEAAARMALDYQDRRVRCYVEQRDQQGRIIGELEFITGGIPAEPYGLDQDGE
ncbi:MAG: hypothetical protein H0W83_09410 [Planctomycetes bacterium]|nr:hypothetical protein [Planctomycetota bacterium]